MTKKLYVIRNLIHDTFITDTPRFKGVTNAKTFAGEEHAESYIKRELPSGYYKIESIIKKS